MQHESYHNIGVSLRDTLPDCATRMQAWPEVPREVKA